MADKKISALTASATPLAGTEVLPIVQSGATVKVAVSDLTAGRAVSMSGLTVTSTGLNIPTITGGSGTNEGAAIYYKASATLTTAFGDTSAIMGGTPATSATIYTGSAMPLNIAVSGANKWQFNAAGNLVVVNSGNGIDFSATPGTGTSELLADYEEGTWTPTLEGNDINFTSVTYDSSVYGTYVKVGKLVHIQGYMRTDAVTIGSAATYVIIAGLPFTPVNAACLSVSDVESWTVNNPSFLRIQASNTYMFIQYRTTANGSYSLLTPVAVATGADANCVRFSGTYITS